MIEHVAKTGTIVQDAEGKIFMIIVDEDGSTDHYYRWEMDMSLLRKLALEATGITLKPTLK